MSKARVSAIIPVYNCPKYIGQAIDSILSQTFRPCEIIVVDDGSTDDTREALEPYMDSIIYVHQKNAGEPAARNTGIRHATGEYIAFLDADDMWLPDKLKFQMECFGAHPEYALVYTDMSTFDENGIIDRSVRVARGRVYASGSIFANLFAETLFQSSSVVLRKDAAEAIGAFNESFLIGCDTEMWLRMSRHYKFGFVDMPLVMYRQHAQMATQTLARIPQGGMPWLAKVLNRTLELYPEIWEELGEAAVNRRLAVPYAWLGRTLMTQGNHVEGRKLLSGALRLTPWNLRYRVMYFCTFLSPSHATRVGNVYRKFHRAIHLQRDAEGSGARVAVKHEECNE